MEDNNNNHINSNSDVPRLTLKKEFKFDRGYKMESLEYFWVRCLLLFGSDYSETYERLLIDELLKGEIDDFSRCQFYRRMKKVLDFMPEPNNTAIGQNVPHDVQVPRSYGANLEVNNWRMVVFYQSYSGSTLLSLWTDNDSGYQVKLELFEDSSFLHSGDEFTQYLQKFFNSDADVLREEFLCRPSVEEKTEVVIEASPCQVTNMKPKDLDEGPEVTKISR
jgi:hypothetical protein